MGGGGGERGYNKIGIKKILTIIYVIHTNILMSHNNQWTVVISCSFLGFYNK